MSDFDPGPGWRRVNGMTWSAHGGLQLDENGAKCFWVREEPVPALPTEPGWYRNRRIFGVLFLDRDGNWITAARVHIKPEDIHDRDLELIEPRAMTAKAVLDRVHAEYDDDDAVLRKIAREFGVTE